MEIITLFGVICLVLIVVSGVIKQMKAKKLARELIIATIKRMK